MLPQIHGRPPLCLQNIDLAVWLADSIVLESPVSGSLWQCYVETGEPVREGQAVLILESMKMEITVSAPQALNVRNVVIEAGQRISAGQPLIVLEES